MSIGSRLREERERLGVSQAELAERTGISRVTLGRYETDKREPGTGFLEAIGRLGLRAEYILTGTVLEGDALQLRALWDVVAKIATALEIPHEVFVLAAEKAAEEAAAWAHLQATEDLSSRIISDALSASAYTLPQADHLASLLERVEFVLQSRPAKISPIQKAKAILDIYQFEQRAKQRADFAHIEDALLSRAQ